MIITIQNYFCYNHPVLQLSPVSPTFLHCLHLSDSTPTPTNIVWKTRKRTDPNRIWFLLFINYSRQKCLKLNQNRINRVPSRNDPSAGNHIGMKRFTWPGFRCTDIYSNVTDIHWGKLIHSTWYSPLHQSQVLSHWIEIDWKSKRSDSTSSMIV